MKGQARSSVEGGLHKSLDISPANCPQKWTLVRRIPPRGHFFEGNLPDLCPRTYANHPRVFNQRTLNMEKGVVSLPLREDDQHRELRMSQCDAVTT